MKAVGPRDVMGERDVCERNIANGELMDAAAAE